MSKSLGIAIFKGEGPDDPKAEPLGVLEIKGLRGRDQVITHFPWKEKLSAYDADNNVVRIYVKSGKKK